MTVLPLALVLSLSAGALTPGAATLSVKGLARMGIAVSEQASPRVKAAAQTLADQLKRITGSGFILAEGDGTSGLAVGRVGDFPALGLDAEIDGKGLDRREQYLLRSHEKGIAILGATDLAVEDAVWDLLYRIGYRQFFPTAAWEIVPDLPDLAVRVDARESPSFYSRSIWYGFGTSDFNAASYERWQTRNRAPGGFALKTSHAYKAIIKRHKDEFDSHPEYLGLLNGVRRSTKLCVSNPGLRELVARDAVDYFQRNPEADSYSVEPSDGGDWCECSACAALGSPSDRALTLANAAAAAVAARWPDKFVAFYAYHLHSPPPEIDASSNVIVSVATAFTRGRTSPQELLTGWRRRGASSLGVREYYSVNTWDRSLPGRPKGADLGYLRESIPRFHALGARFMSAESSDNWGPTGLAYYVAARLLWNVREAEDVPKLVDDFLDKSFGAARAPMSEFYAILSSGGKPSVDAALIKRLYGLLARASTLSSDAAVRARIEDLALYVRYVELYDAYRRSVFGRQEAFERVVRHAYRMRDREMVHVKPLFTDVAKRDRLIRLSPEADWSVPEPRNPLKSSLPFSREELNALLARGEGGAP